jgi:hypothetical protein
MSDNGDEYNQLVRAFRELSDAAVRRIAKDSAKKKRRDAAKQVLRERGL